MNKHDRVLLKLANRVIGPVFLVVGLLVAMYMLESEALPLAREAVSRGEIPRFGFVAILVITPLVVVFFGLKLIMVRKVRRKGSGD